MRRPEVTQAVEARSIAAQPARAATALVARRPMAVLPTLLASAVPYQAVVPVLLGSIGLWTARRRE